MSSVSNVVILRCCDEVDRSLVEQVMSRPAWRPPVLHPTTSSLVTIRTDPSDESKNQILITTILFISDSQGCQAMCEEKSPRSARPRDKFAVDSWTILKLLLLRLMTSSSLPLKLSTFLLSVSKSHCKVDFRSYCYIVSFTLSAGVPGLPRYEALPRLMKHDHVLSAKLIMRIRDEENHVVELFDGQGNSINDFINKILTSKEETPPTVAQNQVKMMKNQWNSSLFIEESVLDPRNLSHYQTLPDGPDPSCVVLHYKSSSEFYICSKEIFKQLKQFQVHCKRNSL